MKKLLLFTGLAVCWCVGLNAQEWDMFHEGRIYNFAEYTGAHLTHQIWVDSTAEIDGGTMYYLNRIAQRVDDAMLPANLEDGVYFTNNGPEFLMKRAFVRNDSVWLQDTASYLLLPKAEDGTTWVFDTVNNISATCEVLTTCPGTRKLITIGDREIYLDKYQGVYQWPMLSEEIGYYYQIGSEGEDYSWGYQRPSMHDFFDFPLNAGFSLEHDGGDPDGCSWEHEYRVLIDKEITDESVELTFARKIARCPNNDCNCDKSDASTQVFSHDTIVVTHNIADMHVVNAGLNTLIKTPNYVNENTVFDGEFELMSEAAYSIVSTYQDNNNLIFAAGYQGADLTVTQMDTLYAPKAYLEEYDLYRNIEMGDPLIISSHFTEDRALNYWTTSGFEFSATVRLEDYVDNGLIWLGVEESELNKDVCLYPNPTSKTVYIDGLESEMDYAIYSMDGKCVKRGMVHDCINIEDITQGIYIVEIDGKNKHRLIVK